MEIKKELNQLVETLNERPTSSNSLSLDINNHGNGSHASTTDVQIQSSEKSMENSDKKKERKKLTIEQSQKFLNSCFALIELKKKALGTMDKMIYAVFKEAVENNLNAKESSYDSARFAKIQNGVKIFFSEYYKSNFSEKFLIDVIKNKPSYTNPLFRDKILDHEMRSFCAEQSALFFPHLEEIAKKDSAIRNPQAQINNNKKSDTDALNDMKSVDLTVNQRDFNNECEKIVERKPSNRM